MQTLLTHTHTHTKGNEDSCGLSLTCIERLECVFYVLDLILGHMEEASSGRKVQAVEVSNCMLQYTTSLSQDLNDSEIYPE